MSVWSISFLYSVFYNCHLYFLLRASYGDHFILLVLLDSEWSILLNLLHIPRKPWNYVNFSSKIIRFSKLNMAFQLLDKHLYHYHCYISDFWYRLWLIWLLTRLLVLRSPIVHNDHFYAHLLTIKTINLLFISFPLRMIFYRYTFQLHSNVI